MIVNQIRNWVQSNSGALLKRLLFTILVLLLLAIYLPLQLTAYSYQHYARLPLDGVAFSSVIGVFGGVFFGVLYTIYLSLMLSIVRSFKRFRKSRRKGDLKTGFSKSDLWFVASFLLVLSFLFIPDSVRHVRANGLGSLFIVVPMFALFFSVWFSSFLWVKNEETILTVAFVALFFGAFLRYFVFGYPILLANIGYGGGIPVTVITYDGEFERNLFLRTNRALLLYDCGNKKFLEIPMRQVRSISHDPLKRLDTCLP